MYLTLRLPPIIIWTADESNSKLSYSSQVKMKMRNLCQKILCPGLMGGFWGLCTSCPSLMRTRFMSLHPCQPHIYYPWPPHSVHTKDQSLTRPPKNTLTVSTIHLTLLRCSDWEYLCFCVYIMRASVCVCAVQSSYKKHWTKPNKYWTTKQLS